MQLTSVQTFWSSTPVQVGDLRLIVDHPIQVGLRSSALIEFNRQREGNLLFVLGIHKQKIFGHSKKTKIIFQSLIMNHTPIEQLIDEQCFYYTELISRAQNEEILPG
jgi:hypothetical protein